MLTWTTAALVLMCAYAYLWWQSNAWRWFAKLPTYPCIPLLGNIYKLHGGGEKVYRRLVEISEITDKKQLPFVLWLGPVPMLLLSNLEDIKAVSQNYIEKPYYYSFGKIWLGNGLITAPGSIWKRNIKKLGGAFTGSIVDNFQDVFNTHAQKLVSCLKTEVGKEPFDVMYKYLAATTLEAICQTALGVPKISDSIVTEDYYQAFTKALELFTQRALNIVLHPDFIFRLTPWGREMENCVKRIHNVSETVMKKRQEKLDSRQNKEESNSETDTGSFKSYIDILLELNARDPGFTTKQIRNEVDTIILAGQETVATALFYTMLMIGRNTEVQNKLHVEMKEIFGESKREIDKEDLVRMTYCDAVINETLRLYPPAPGVIRYADHDLKCESCTIPKGTACAINFYGVGRSKRYWGPDALEFRPERWLSGSVPIAAQIAFSTGKRACIGKKYAMAIMKTMVAYCVRELVLISEADELQLRWDLALRPATGHLLQIRLRE